jgi:hypothetical protein
MRKHYLIAFCAFLSCGKYTKKSGEKKLERVETTQPSEIGSGCAGENAQVCTDLVSEIDRLQGLLTGYIEKKDTANSEKAALDLSYAEEQLHLYKLGKGAGTDEWTALDKKYAALRNLFLTSSSSGSINNPGQTAFRPYSQVELASITKIFAAYGALFIGPSELNAEDKPIHSSVEAKGEKPWTGYWYPSQKDTMFGAEDSTLQKYDRYLTRKGRSAGATAIEKEKYSPLAPEWAGLCDAWSMAAIAELEPKHSVVREGITFEISDIKALLTKKYEGFEPVMYGSRYNGTVETDGEIDDIRPEAMHQLIVSSLAQDGRSLIVDDDPAFEVWNKPLYAMRWTVTQDPTIASAYLVKAWPKMVRNRSEVSENPTDVYDVKAPSWEYRLYVDRSQVGADGKSYKVIYGEWLDKTRDIHPDMALFLPKEAVLHPRNQVIADTVDLINQIAAAAQ